MIRSSKKFKVLFGTLFLAVLALFTVTYAAHDDGKISLSKTAKRYDDYGRKSQVVLNVSADSYTKSRKLDIVLVLDGSGSMAYGPKGKNDKVNVNNPSRLTSAKVAAKTFISALISDDDSVKIGLVEYGRVVKNTQALTENEKILNNFIDNKYSANGGTNLQAGIEKAHELLDNGSREGSKKLVVILTDGIPTLFNYEGEVLGNGNTDDSICLKGGFFGCDLQKKPSEAAKEELDSLKNSYKESDVYTITLGNEREAANILSKVNPERENPLYKNYKALTGDELQERFNEILNNEIKIIGSGSVVTDTIPAKFKLTKESESNLAKKGVEIIENEDGSTTLKWNIGTIEASKNYSLSYDVEALDDYHGSMYTNTSATLKTTVKEDNPYYDGKTNQELEFNKPTTQVPIITRDDSYSGYENEEVKGSIFDNDLNKIKELDKEKQTDKLEVRDTLIVGEDVNTVKNNDGTYTIYKDGVAQGTLTIDEDGKFTFTPNEGIVGDVSFKYSITTDVITNGKKDLVYSNESTVVIKIKPIKRVEVEGSKSWIDNDNQDGIRPDKITVKLLANGEVVDSKTVSSKDNWTYKFTNLSKYTKYHEGDSDYLIKYTVEENEVAGYTTKVEGYDIINTHEAEKTEVAGAKTWVDNNNQDGKRPDTITVRLLADGVDTGLMAVASADTDWKYSFTNLDKKVNGKDIVYTVTEDEVESYQGVVDGYNITNTHTPETITFSFEKIWVDGNNQDGIRPDKIKINLLADGEIVDTKEIAGETRQNWQASFKDLPKYNNGREIEYSVKEEDVPLGYEVSYKDNNTIINTHSPSKMVVEGTKTWVDENNNDGIRPDKITVKLFADNVDTGKTLEVSSKTNWKYKFEDLPEYRDGNKIIYTVSEEDVLGYSSEIRGFDIVNTHSVEKISISGTKIWNDYNNNDGIRTDEITVKLLADGIDTGKTATASVDTNWQYSFTDLNKYKNGEKITYSLEEVSVDGYVSEVNQEDYSIINTHAPETITYTVNKKWVDVNNNDGIRPEFINVSILANGVVIDKASLSKENNWTYTFGPYNKYENGNLIQYTIVEDDVKGYVQTIEDGVIDDNNNITSVITNTHEVEKETITINKIWNDNNNEQQTRPEFIKVKLLANGEVIREFTITKDMNWSYILDNLNKYYNGKLINYSILEDKVDNYQTSYNGFDIINTLTKKYEKAEIIPPQTGDNSGDSGSILFMMLGLLSLALALKRTN